MVRERGMDSIQQLDISPVIDLILLLLRHGKLKEAFSQRELLVNKLLIDAEVLDIKEAGPRQPRSANLATRTLPRHGARHVQAVWQVSLCLLADCNPPDQASRAPTMANRPWFPAGARKASGFPTCIDQDCWLEAEPAMSR